MKYRSFSGCATLLIQVLGNKLGRVSGLKIVPRRDFGASYMVRKEREGYRRLEDPP